MLSTAEKTMPDIEASHTKKSNIIVVMVDDLGYSDLGCYGQELIRTPNIDRMATEGMRFTDFYARTSAATAARSARPTSIHWLMAGSGLRRCTTAPGAVHPGPLCSPACTRTRPESGK